MRHYSSPNCEMFSFVIKLSLSIIKEIINDEYNQENY